MDNERTVVLENVSKQPVGLKDTQNRVYRFGVDGKIRISEVSLQDILDYPASKIILNEGMIKIGNINPDRLYKMGLTEDEIKKFLSPNNTYEEEKEEVVEEVKEEIKEEEPVEEIKAEEEKVEEEAPVPEEEPEVEPEPVIAAPAKKAATTKKTAKKSSRKKK